MAARRAPAAAERQRDAERSRRRILEAALTEFAERGFAGARTSAIARGAGVNPQLISYYFDGKAGLYRELTRRGRQDSGQLADPDTPLTEVVAAFLRLNRTQRQWARLLIWESLSPSEDTADTETTTFFQNMIETVQQRQQRGDLAADLDPGTVLLVLFATTFAPVALPQLTTHVTGYPADSAEATELLVAHLEPILTRLQ